MMQRLHSTRRPLLALLVVMVAVFGLPVVVDAEPGEDGAHPDPPGYYDPAPLGGWMTERAGDRVHDFAQIGNTVYVAGTFTGIRPGPGGPITWQSNLAAFDATTGEHLPVFDPVVNGTVYSLAVAPDGSRLYAGGTFTTVDGGDHRRLAALDPVTGAPVAGFDADVSGGSVRSVVARAGDLYIGGNFSSVEGVARTRLALLQAGSGAVDPTWAPVAEGQVFTLEIPADGSRVYVGGRFASINGSAGSAYLAAVRPTDGSVDPTFTGQPGREVFDLVATADGRVYVAEGGFLGRAEAYDTAGVLLGRWETGGDVQAVEQIGDLIFFGGHDFGPDEADEVAVVDPDDLTIFDVDAFKPVSTGGDRVWAFHATASELWMGGQGIGPQNGFARHRPIAPPPPREDLVPVGATWAYLDDGSESGTAWRDAGFDDSGWASGPAQLGFGDGDEATTMQPGQVTYRFRYEIGVADAAALSDLRLSMVVDDGAVAYINGTEVVRTNMPDGPVDASTPASDYAWGPAETTFVSFDVPDGVLVDGANVLAVEVHQVTPGSSDVSFDGRLTAVGVTPDTTAPSAPAGLDAPDPADTSFTVSWDPSTDAGGIDRYEVSQDGVLIGSTATTSFDVDDLTPETSYQMTVEAVDTAGNRSGPSSPLAVRTAAAPPAPTELIATGSPWRYLDDGSEQGSAWRQPGFDDASWATGPAQLGVADGQATTMAGGAVTYWLRRSFSVADASAITQLDLEMLVDDGAVVYVNGVEVARDNMPGGPITASSNAVEYRWGAAEQEFRPFPISTTPLVDGVNVLAVEVHQAPWSGDLSFDARLESTGGVADTTPPSVPGGLAETGTTESSIGVTWTPSGDDVGVDRYELFVDGAAAGSSLAPPATVGGLAPATTYRIEVEAVDGAGNRSGRSTPLSVATSEPPGGGPVTFISQGSTWAFLDTGADPGGGWTSAGFDDAGWATGPAELGLGDGDEVTSMAGGPVTYRFRGSFMVASAAGVGELVADLLADDGAVVYLNGVEVIRDNMPSGPITASTAASTYRWGAAERAYRSFPIASSVLVDGVNTIAVEVHQAPGSVDLSFDLGLHGVQ